MFTAPLIQTIGSLLKGQQQIALSIDANGTPQIKPLGIFARLRHWKDAEFHQKRLSDIAALAARILKAQPCLSIHAASKDFTIHTCKKLLKHINSSHIHNSKIQELAKHITAAKLGLNSRNLDCSPGFQEFAEIYHLDRYLLDYEDKINVDSTTNEVMLRQNNQIKPWHVISNDMKQWPELTHSPKQPWVYGPQGIQNKDMYEWTELRPYKKDDPAKWQHQYILEVCACYNPQSIKTGNHSWIRLKTPSGDIYSVGLYRPGKADWTHNLRQPLRVKAGYLMQPDVSEFWPYEIFTVDIAITEQDFLKMKETIERDKKEDNLLFQLFNNNCLLYCKKIAAVANIDLPTKETVVTVLTPKNLQHAFNKGGKYVPGFIQKIGLIVISFFINIALVFLGACNIDSNLNVKQKKRAIAHLQSIEDLFSPQKASLNHPSTLSFKTRPIIMEWRKQEINNLVTFEKNPQQLIEQSKKILFGVPPSFKKTSHFS